MGNSFSKSLLEAFFCIFPKVKWKSLDNDEPEQIDGAISDYEICHNDLGLTIIELKELQDSDDIQKQQKIVDEINRQLKNVFQNIAFHARFDGDNPPTHKQIADFKNFLLKVKQTITSPCRIVLPIDPICPMFRLVEIKRIDDKGELIEKLYSPVTTSNKYPRERGKIDNFRRLRDPCLVIDRGMQSAHEEREIFHEKDKAQLSLLSTKHGKSGSIYCHRVGGWLAEDDRIRDRLHKAAKQLKRYKNLNCPLGFVCCPSGYRFADFEDLVDAIMGKYQIAFQVVKKGESSAREPKAIHGGDRMLQHNKNTTISYCGWLEANGKEPLLKIIHNDFSTQKLPYEFFDSPSTKQYIIQYKAGIREVKGKLGKVTSSEQLEAIRASNKRPIALMRGFSSS